MNELEIFIPGEPIQKGSYRSFVVPGKDGKKPRAVTTNHSPKTAEWERLTKMCAKEAMWEAGIAYDKEKAAYQVEMTFIFKEPKSAGKKALRYIKRPDLDKLVRAILDGLTDVVFPDDAWVDDIHARKRYLLPKDDGPGCLVKITKLPEILLEPP
jgi:Holliday junction resolvase RusA-like endonuclease